MRWSSFAWQGIRLDVPDAWNLGAIEGDFRKGYVRLEDDEIVRVEVKWERGRRTTSPERAMAGLLAGMERVAKKRGLKFHSKCGLSLVDRRDDREAECCEWTSDFRAYDMVSRCDVCRRVVLLRVLTRQGESMKREVRRIFNSLTDHALDGRLAWSVYGFGFAAPEAYRLKRSLLTAGRIELSLRRGRDELLAGRVGVPEIALRGRDMETWLREEYEKVLRPWRVRISEAEFKGHAALDVRGKRRWRSAVPGLVSGRPELRAKAWRCEQADKIYLALRTSSRGADTSEFDRFAESFACH